MGGSVVKIPSVTVVIRTGRQNGRWPYGGAHASSPSSNDRRPVERPVKSLVNTSAVKQQMMMIYYVESSS